VLAFPHFSSHPTIMKIFAIAFLSIFAAIAVQAFPGNPIPENAGVYNFSTITVTTSPAQITPRDSHRNYILIQNNGTVSVVIKPGSNPTSATNGIVLAAGASYAPLPALVDAWYAESASSTATLTIIEGIK
jgi:hypothetical protein